MTFIKLAEDRLITKAEFVDRKERLEGERQAWEDELAGVEAELEARAATAVHIEGTLASLRRLSDVYDELEEVSERRRLLEICLGRLVIRPRPSSSTCRPIPPWSCGSTTVPRKKRV